MEATKLACVYARVSTDKQDTRQQINDLKRYAKYKGYKIFKIYDEQISGTTEGESRSAFADMLLEIQKGEIKHILVWELSRLGRSVLDVLKNVELFTKLGVNIFIHKENLSTLNDDGTQNATSKLFISMLGGFAEFELETTRQRIIRGVKDSKTKGSANGGALQYYGFKNESKKLVINVEEAEIIKQIFNMYTEKEMGTSSIANELQHRSIPTKYNSTFSKKIKISKGKYRSPNAFIWVDAVIWNILRNSIYRGLRRTKSYPEYRGNPNFIKRDPKKYKHLNFDKWDYIPLDDQIISTSQWNKAQEILNSKSNQAAAESKFINIVKGLISCSNCNQPYFMHKRSSKNGLAGRDNAYRCLSKRGGRYGEVDCKNVGANIDKVNFIVHNILTRVDTNTNPTPELLKEMQDLNLKQEKNDRRLKRLLKQKKKYLKQGSTYGMKDNVLKELLAENSQDQHEATELSNHFKAEYSRLEDKLYTFNDPWSKISTVPTDASMLKDTIKKLVSKVVVSKSDKTFPEHFPNPKDTITQIDVTMISGQKLTGYLSRFTSKYVIVEGEPVAYDAKLINILL